MEPCELKRIAESCRASVHGNVEDIKITSVCTDTRQLTPGCLFVALKGERFDGHHFIREAAEGGAVAVLIEDEIETSTAIRLKVKDTRKSLGEIAAAYRNTLKLRVCAVAGSNGKTTTKELIASVLSVKLNTVKSPASFNNDIGVPLALLQIESRHEAAVLEAGTNHPGELATLVRMIRPEYGVLTNIGHEHLEFFGDIQGVAKEEGMLAEEIPVDGTLFLNADDPFSDEISTRCQGRIVKAGFAADAEWKAVNYTLDSEGAVFEVTAPSAAYNGEYRVNLIGRHQISNALFAIAMGAETGLDPEQIRKGLAACRPGSLRMQKTEVRGATLLVDCYNANTDSMKAALQTLAEFPCSGRRIAVLGDMAELGEHSGNAHFETGRFAAESGVDLLVAVGKFADDYASGAKEAGFSNCKQPDDADAAFNFLRPEIRAGDVVLLKASRAVNLERISHNLQEAD